ncbi:MAG: hypothetical protein KA715_13575 [Xanthomonadaceae bacterium]|nr:hypothetical protein [Xanthomonadaceae bacterium]
MKPWTRYIIKRFPLQEQIPLIAGLVLTGAGLQLSPMGIPETIISVIGITLFLFLARLQIDTRDYLQDVQRTQHQKPLARSIVRLNDLKAARWFCWAGLMVFGIVLFILEFSTAGLALLAMGAWMGIAGKNYFLRHILSGHPFIHSFLDHCVLFPITLFSVAAFQPTMINEEKIIGVGGIFALTLMNRELVKNLDPHSHSILKNYHSLIGAERTWVAMILISTVMIALSILTGWWIPVATTQVAFHLFFAFLYLRTKRWDLIARMSFWFFIIYAWVEPVRQWLK